MKTKTERFEMRLEKEALDKVDLWRGNQQDLPSRAEAVRRLVETGLSMTSRKPLKLSDGEKLTVLMLCEVYKHLGMKSEIDPLFVAAAIHGGHYWALKWEYPGIFHGEEYDERVVTEVVQILGMWSSVETAYGALSKKDKARVETEAHPFGTDVRFHGFDGNYEGGHLGVAYFLMNDMDRFSSFKGRDLNSHMPMIDAYRRMLSKFETMQRDLVGIDLNASQVVELLQEARHPDGS